MPNAKPKSKIPSTDYVRMYYEHQYDRINKHQEQALNMSNIVLTTSTLIITFGLGNRQSLGTILVLFLPLILLSINFFAILFVTFGGKQVAQHQLRAKRVLEIYAFEIYMIDKETTVPRKKWAIDRIKLQIFIHYLFILFGVILLALFVLELFGVSIV
jgi:hypothetical protein